jgi:hypothetical protein
MSPLPLGCARQNSSIGAISIDASQGAIKVAVIAEFVYAPTVGVHGAPPCGGGVGPTWQ